MKFLVIRFSSIGDIVLTTPVVRCLKQQVPGAEIHYLTKKNFAGILQTNPNIDKVHILDNNLDQVISTLKLENYDAVIDLHNNLRSTRIKLKLKSPSYSFSKLNIEKWLMVNFKINKLPQRHIVDRYMDAVSSFGVKNDMRGLDYFIPAIDEVDLSSIPLNSYTAIVIGAAHATKRLPIHKLLALCKKIEGSIVLLGGKEDASTGEQIKEADPARIYNACGKYNLNQSASLVKQASFIISHDTGLMHIASAFHKPMISVWGNTIPGFGMYPYAKDALIAEVNGLPCRPCSKIGYHKCPRGHFKCMENQDLDGIAAAVRK